MTSGGVYEAMTDCQNMFWSPDRAGSWSSWESEPDLSVTFVI